MLRELNHRLANVAESMAEFDSQIGQYLERNDCSCQVTQQNVYLEYQHDLTFEQASEQAQTLLKILDIPYGDSSGGGKSRNLLADIAGKEHRTKLHFDLSCGDESDLLLQYLCSQLLKYFQQLETRLATDSTCSQAS
ncbi:hypothetical protein [Vibrio sp. CAU 1672]|uniref:hypothetical protein n=1 Tax=Vibrio sp. CAU 1672 TaxID=3032594 RepID=UPI0023DAB582|nr:hypothetical protein [Vibrio sp. CAU 1672]MDF2154580.1 hypothetical protein [Vibrio sp. CAU 1672]